MLVEIDVSLRSHHVQFMSETGESLASFSIPNDRNDADTFGETDAGDCHRKQSRNLQIGMEATSSLGLHLILVLCSYCRRFRDSTQSDPRWFLRLDLSRRGGWGMGE
ncbi:IS110 family transposase [Brevibacillus daliensis]|uniref:IS110 family transposase n=1 Tax=Brevibacillus daliensis TaxID=2892995 RepID=UPI0035A04E06